MSLAFGFSLFDGCQKCGPVLLRFLQHPQTGLDHLTDIAEFARLRSSSGVRLTLMPMTPPVSASLDTAPQSGGNQYPCSMDAGSARA